MKPLGDAFIKLIRMMIAPIIFGTVVVGIAKMGDMKQVGRIGLRALIYFEVVSTIALVIGLVFVNVMKPGAGINANAAQLDPDRRRRLHVERLAPDDHRLPDEHHPDDDRQRVRDGRHPAGPVLLRAVRRRSAAHGDAGKAAGDLIDH